MAGKKVFIEQRPDGDYAVLKPGAQRASVLKPTQSDAIKWAKDHGYKHPDIERVRHTPEGGPDKWRK